MDGTHLSLEAFDFTGDPVLIVGWRPEPRQLDGVVIDVHAEAFSSLRGIAEQTVLAFENLSPVEWSPNAFLEPREQYFIAASEAITGGNEPQHAATLHQLVLNPGVLLNGGLSDLPDVPRFYAIVWEEGLDGRPVAFVNEYKSISALREGRTYLRFEGTLRPVEPPDLALEERTDLIVTEDVVCGLRLTSFDRLFADIRALLNDVPTNVTKLRSVLTQLPMTKSAADAFTRICEKRPSYAKRLQLLAEDAAHAAKLTPAALTKALKRHNYDPKDFLANGYLIVDETRVAGFLDVAEGRIYEADITEERRRAARWSKV